MQSATALRRARIAATVAFATNGALPATLLARYAEVKQALNLDAAEFGLAVVGFTLGAAGALQLPGVALRCFGSRWIMFLGTAWITLALMLAVVGVANANIALFVIGLILAGFGDAVVDVAQNAQGLRVQHVYGKSVLSSMHAGWSVGAAVGGVVGTAAASVGIPLFLHLAMWGIFCTTIIGCATRYFLQDARPGRTDESEFRALDLRALRMLTPLALVALAGFAVEDVGTNWSAVLLATERHVPASAAGIGLSVLLAAQFIGRLLGDGYIDRVGKHRALITSLGTIVIGLSMAAWAPGVPATLMGFALAGLGCAITVPLAFAGADTVPGLRPHAGVTWIGWSMRAASIGLSPAIGVIATLASLPIAITVISLLAVLALGVQLWRVQDR